MSGPTLVDGRSGGTGQVSPLPAATDIAAEQAVLGSLILLGTPKRVLVLVKKGLTPGCFWWDRHAAIFAACVSLAERQVDVDVLTIHREMERLGTADAVTEGQIDELTGYVPAADHVSTYADQVLDKARWRKRRSHVWKMLKATEQLDPEAWDGLLAELAPPTATSQVGTSMLRLVNESGEVVGEQEQKCDSCQALEDQLSGAQTEIAGWRTRFAKLKSDKEAEARKNALYLPAQALFEHWKRLTGHKNSKWGAGRFYDAEPLLRKYGVEVFERAIAGIAHDPYTKVRRNGTTQRYDAWSSLCKSMDNFEEYANRAPKGWTVTLKLSVETEREEETAPRLQAVPAS